MLLQALCACAGVTLRAVATALKIPIKEGSVHASGILDMRGTLGVVSEAPVGFKNIDLSFDLNTEATEEELALLMKLTERYCVVFQTLTGNPKLTIAQKSTGNG
ncbi:MAG TPA: OsmC family peroxiredoxin, partial [Alphaproteobacteria bacterium]|nr:OsmC family peroxiredoxin [Alphaproteobacteria bacterium]